MVKTLHKWSSVARNGARDESKKELFTTLHAHSKLRRILHRNSKAHFEEFLWSFMLDIIYTWRVDDEVARLYSTRTLKNSTTRESELDDEWNFDGEILMVTHERDVIAIYREFEWKRHFELWRVSWSEKCMNFETQVKLLPFEWNGIFFSIKELSLWNIHNLWCEKGVEILWEIYMLSKLYELKIRLETFCKLNYIKILLKFCWKVSNF